MADAAMTVTKAIMVENRSSAANARRANLRRWRSGRRQQTHVR